MTTTSMVPAITIPSSAHTSSSGLSSYQSPVSVPSTPVQCRDTSSCDVILVAKDNSPDCNRRSSSSSSCYTERRTIDKHANGSANLMDDRELERTNDDYIEVTCTIRNAERTTGATPFCGSAKVSNIEQTACNEGSDAPAGHNNAMNSELCASAPHNENSISSSDSLVPLDFTASDTLRCRLGCMIINTRACLAYGVQLSRVETHPIGEEISDLPEFMCELC